MDKERLDDSQDDNISPAADVSHKNIFIRLADKAANFFMRIGLYGIKLLAALLLGIIKSIHFFLSELWGIIRALGKGLLWIIKSVVKPFTERMKITADMQRALRKAKKEGRSAYIRTFIKCAGA